MQPARPPLFVPPSTPQLLIQYPRHCCLAVLDLLAMFGFGNDSGADGGARALVSSSYPPLDGVGAALTAPFLWAFR